MTLFCGWCCMTNEDQVDQEEQQERDDRPLLRKHRQTKETEEKAFQKRIRESYVDLGNVLDTESGLLSILFSKGVLSQREKQIIQSERVEFRKNERLLDMLMKKSEREFAIFIDALIDSNQSHVARILQKDGVLLPVHINIEAKRPLVDLKGFEVSLANRLNEAASKISRPGGSSLDEIESMITSLLADVRHKKAELVRAIPDRSILLYFFCPELEVLNNISLDCCNGELSQRLRSIVVVYSIQTSTRYRIVDDELKKYSRHTISVAGRGRAEMFPAVRIHVTDEDQRKCRETFCRDSRFPRSVTLILYVRRSFRRWKNYSRFSQSGVN